MFDVCAWVVRCLFVDVVWVCRILCVCCCVRVVHENVILCPMCVFVVDLMVMSFCVRNKL